MEELLRRIDELTLDVDPHSEVPERMKTHVSPPFIMHLDPATLCQWNQQLK
jgi:hypothetical protein